jgi:hypothetical protein
LHQRWTADTQTAESRKEWQTTLTLGAAPAGLAAVTYTSNYVKAFEEEAAKAKDSSALVEAMKTR